MENRLISQAHSLFPKLNKLIQNLSMNKYASIFKIHENRYFQVMVCFCLLLLIRDANVYIFEQLR